MPLHRSRRPAALRVLFAGACLATTTTAAAQQQRSMTFLDVQQMRSVQGLDISPDGRWALYALSVPDWQEARSTTDVWLVSMDRGAPSARQMTFTRDRSESSPTWASDGATFVFASNRDAPASASGQNQLYVMRPDGGEARKVTDAKDGVSQFAFTRDGRWLVYAAGRAEDRQLWALPATLP